MSRPPHRRRSTAATSPITPTPPTASRISNLHRSWVETDTYDRNAFRELKADSPSLQELERSGGKLLPHFGGFLIDLFAVLFKMNVIVRPPDSVVPSAALYRMLIEHIRASSAFETLRRQTILDETRAGLATLLLGSRLLDVLKSERPISRGDMLDFWALDQQEQEISSHEEEAETASELRDQATAATQRQLDELRQRLQRENESASRRLQQKAAQVQQSVRENFDRHRARFDAPTLSTLNDLDGSQQEADTWSREIGGGGRTSAGAQIELGKKLADNAKLKKLAQMVGRMRTQALTLRQKLFERSNEEMYEVGLGDELSRLLPQELLALRHPLLRRDFNRRFLDRSLAQYSLRGLESKGRGPMIVCIDGSSSMSGDKEIWAKAVSLTLLDIAQRQRRLFRSICFSSVDTPLQILDLDRQLRYVADMNQVFALAEYFPGGGTDFQKPLDAALECLHESQFKRGDIVFITDGECRVDPTWLVAFKRAKVDLAFSLLSV
ncbi:MAG: hypothetical protein HY270_14510, partial [Deltaproteobacteria bacterium]|nr:hypothetical protein [Deltaproteobacteria bacterium]